MLKMNLIRQEELCGGFNRKMNRELYRELCDELYGELYRELYWEVYEELSEGLYGELYAELWRLGTQIRAKFSDSKKMNLITQEELYRGLYKKLHWLG
jgi:hypothetical protein